MSDSMTVVQVPLPNGQYVERYGLHGHMTREAALTETREYYERVRDETAAVLAALDAGTVKVFHQRGVYVGRNRSEVTE